MIWFNKSSTPTLSTPAPARAVHEGNSKFILGIVALIALVALAVILGIVFMVGKRSDEKAFNPPVAAMAVDDRPLIDMSAIKSRKAIDQVVNSSPPLAPAAPIEEAPQLPPPDEAPVVAALPPPAPAPAPKKEWVKPEMNIIEGSKRKDRGDGGQGGSGSRTPVQAAGMAPRNDREAFAMAGGRGRPLYHVAGELPPLPGCVAKTGAVIQLATLGVVKNNAPGQFALQVVEPYQGVVYDQKTGPRACTHPLIPPRSTVICEPNTVSSGRGDQIIQAVCSRIDFPNGGTLPLNGFPLVAADGSVGVPAESDYPWGDVLKGMAIDIATAIPGALITASAGAIGGGAGVILNVGADGFEEQGQRYKDDEVKIRKTLFIPRAAPTGLFIPADIALPDRRR